MIYLECTGKKEYNLFCEYYKKLIEDINMVTTKEKRKNVLLMGYNIKRRRERQLIC